MQAVTSNGIATLYNCILLGAWESVANCIKLVLCSRTPEADVSDNNGTTPPTTFYLFTSRESIFFV